MPEETASGEEHPSVVVPGEEGKGLIIRPRPGADPKIYLFGGPHGPRLHALPFAADSLGPNPDSLALRLDSLGPDPDSVRAMLRRLGPDPDSARAWAQRFLRRMDSLDAGRLRSLDSLGGPAPLRFHFRENTFGTRFLDSLRASQPAADRLREQAKRLREQADRLESRARELEEGAEEKE